MAAVNVRCWARANPGPIVYQTVWYVEDTPGTYPRLCPPVHRRCSSIWDVGTVGLFVLLCRGPVSHPTAHSRVRKPERSLKPER